MAFFRVQRTREYTVMSNYHLRDQNLTLKAKGLLSMMPESRKSWSSILQIYLHNSQHRIRMITTALRCMDLLGQAEMTDAHFCICVL